MWPTFLVIGAYKSGTTTVHHVLKTHPQVFVTDRKEPNFFAFADHPDPGNPAYPGSVHDEPAYLGLFAHAGAALAVGEVSPEYMTNPAAVDAIARRLPNVTLLAVLRNPVDRAFSDWTMYAREGQEKDSFLDALAQQGQRGRRGLPTGGYLLTGEYADQLEPYFRRFDRTQLHVWLYDDLVERPDELFGEMFAALGVDPSLRLPDSMRYNPGVLPTSFGSRMALSVRNRVRSTGRQLPLAPLRRRLSTRLEERLAPPVLDPAARARLVAHFRPGVERLQALIGRDLSGWLRTDG